MSDEDVFVRFFKRMLIAYAGGVREEEARRAGAPLLWEGDQA